MGRGILGLLVRLRLHFPVRCLSLPIAVYARLIYFLYLVTRFFDHPRTNQCSLECHGIRYSGKGAFFDSFPRRTKYS